MNIYCAGISNMDQQVENHEQAGSMKLASSALQRKMKQKTTYIQVHCTAFALSPRSTLSRQS